MEEVQVESSLLFESPEQICARVFRELKPRTPLPEIQVKFCRFANANSLVRLENRRLTFRISDLLEGAPAPVLEALAQILLCRLFRREVPKLYSYRYRLYLNRRDMRRSIHLIRQIRGRKVLSAPQGEHYDLSGIFDALNVRFFDGLLAQPALGWSRTRSRTVLGHYDPSHNAIVISRLLDAATVPGLVVEYVVFHEMLHLRFPIEHHGARRSVHGPQLRQAEREFPGFKEAKRLIKSLP